MKTALVIISRLQLRFQKPNRVWGSVISCYFRPKNDFLNEAGIEVTVENKKDTDSIFHGLVDVEFENFPLIYLTLL